MKSITVKQLRDSLALLGPAYDDKEVQAWLPGSRIILSESLIPNSGDAVLIEGNVSPGSALDSVIAPSIEFKQLTATLLAQLLPDALCKEKGGLTAASRERCVAVARRIIALMPDDGTSSTIGA